jgi:hypothetical protein
MGKFFFGAMCFFFNLVSVHNVFLVQIQVNKLYVNSVLLRCETLPIFCQPSVWVIQAFLVDIPFSFPHREERFKICTAGRDCNCSLYSSSGYFQMNKFRHTRLFAIIRGTGDWISAPICRQVWSSGSTART